VEALLQHLAPLFLLSGRAYLIYRSRFLPRFIGVLLAMEGAAYLINSFTDFLAPALARRLTGRTGLSAESPAPLMLTQ
jgi:hypothetical protein